ncbi:MAG: aldo/keto reductase [Firmicutes bacterium]|nr:aldo/keto reductase [Bacillota bacterium]
MMEFTQFGATGIEVSRIALGTWAMGGRLWGGTNVEDAIQAACEALEMGITTIDTAPAYGFGLSEKIVAEAIRRSGVPRERVVIATKAGLDWDKDGNTFRNSKPERIRKEIEDSLRYLNTDYIDIYQIHWPDPDTPIEQTAATMKELYDEGKIRAIGVSNYNVEQMETWRKVAPLHSNQPKLNLFNRQALEEVIPYCRENNIAVLAYSPLARGLLTGKFDEDAAFPEGDTRAKDPDFTGERFKRNLRIIAELKKLAESCSKTLAQLAVRWVLDQPGVTIALWGARRPGQIQEAAGAVDWELTPEQLSKIDEIFEKTV